MPENCAAIVIAAKHHELTKVKDTRGTTNTIGALRCKFQFRTDDWLHSVKTAMFCNGDAVLHPEVIDDAISVPLDADDECPVPHEVLTDTLPYSIGVWGVTDTGLRIVSNWLVFGAQQGCYTEGNAPIDPDPTIYEQILLTSQNAVDIANDVLDRANNGEFDGEIGPKGQDGISPIIKTTPINDGHEITFTDAEGTHTISLKNGEKGERGLQGEQGEKGNTGDKGEPGTDGYTPQKGVDYWTEEDKIEMENFISEKTEDKLDKIKLGSKIYGTLSNGTQTAYSLDNNPKGDTVPKRTTTGQLMVQLEPENDDEAASKKYVDDSKGEAISEAKEYTDNVKNDLLHGAGDAYDTLKELGDLIDENQDAIEALEQVATGKANTVHAHVISDVTELQETLDENLTEAKEYTDEKLETKLDKTTEANKIYGTDKDGNQRLFKVSTDAESSAIAYRAGGGYLAVPVTPLYNGHASSKKYTDDKDNEVRAYADSLNSAMNERVTELESLTLTYTEDGSTAYEKAVPAEVGKYALVKMLGGATERVVSKNIINPAEIPLSDYSGYGNLISQNLNADGTITYTVIGPSVYAAVSLADLHYPVGRYYIYYNEPHNVFTDEGYIEIDCSADMNGDDYIETTRTLELMVWQDTSVTTEYYEIVNAPEGTVFEPYFEPYLQDAEVERVESLGKNRLPSDVMIADNWNTTENAQWARYYLDLSDGWYCISLKLKEEYSQKLYLYLQKSVDGGQTYSSSQVGYKDNGTLTYGYLVTASGLENNPFWFKVDKKAGIIYRFNFNELTQSKLDQIYDIQIERVNLTQEPSSSYKPSVYAPATEYSPYKAEPIDTIIIPEGLNLKAVNDTYYDYIECIDDKKFKHEVVRERVLNGTEDWVKSSGANTYFYIVLDTRLLSNNCLCNAYERAALSVTNTLIGVNVANLAAAQSQSCILVRPYNYDTMTVSDFKAQLAEKPITVRVALATPIVTDITDLFTEDNSIEVQSGGVLRFVNEKEMAVPNTIGYVTRKE